MGYECNNSCRFCVHSHRRALKGKDTRRILEEMALMRKRGYTYLELIGGEPTIRPDIVDLISFARELEFEHIMMATNGRLFAYEDFAKRVVDAGLTDLIFSIHGHNSRLHDSLTQVKGSFRQLMQGIENVRAAGLERLGTNTTIVKQNYRQLKKIGELILGLGFANSEFIFVDPQYGTVSENFSVFVPKISRAAPYIRETLDLGRGKISHWQIRYVPLCYFADYLDQISELHESQTFLAQHLAPDFVNKNVEKSRQQIARAKTEKCRGCRLFDKCEGIWKKYLEYYGDKELKPITK